MLPAKYHDSWIPPSAKDWFQWLKEEEQKTRNAYLAKPATLIADYNRELATTRDYEGREILELLQNAVDQEERRNFDKTTRKRTKCRT